MFVDKLLDIMEKMNKKKDGNYDLREFDAHMEEMPKIKHEDKVKKMLINGQKNLHVHGEKAYDALYAELNNLLQELGNAEFLFADNTMKYCGETEKDMFHEKQEEEDD